MSAVLRVCWTFYTAFPLQRWLAIAGVLTGGLHVVGGVWSGDAGFYVLGGIFFTVLAVFPAVFAGGAMLRALSAPRSHQLWPHFRVRMLIAVALFVTALALLPPVVIVLPTFATGRALPAAALVYSLGLVTAVYLWAFLFSGDWRFGLLGPVFLVTVIMILRGSTGSGETIAALVLPLAAVTALLAWVAFGVWYLRVRRVGPWRLTAARRAPWEGPSNRPITRETALLALLTGRVPTSFVRELLTTTALAAVLGLFLGLPSSSRNPQSPPASFVWPFICFISMAIAAMRTVPIAHQSRLLWLRIDGRRDGVRQRIERVAWRYWLTTFAGIVVFALVAPTVRGASLSDLAFGLATCASAVVYGGYVALAAPTGIKTQSAAFALMTVAQIALIVPADASNTSVALAVAAQLAGAALFRAVAVRRWRRVDWLLLQPLAVLGGWRG